MRAVFHSAVLIRTLLVVAGMAGVLNCARAGGPGESIALSPPASAPIAATNSSSASTVRKGSLEPSTYRQLENDIFKPFIDSIKENSMDPNDTKIPLPPQRPQPINERSRQLLEQRKNWAFINLDSAYGQASMEQMMGIQQYGPDGRPLKSRSLVESYYLRDTKGASNKVNGLNSSFQPNRFLFGMTNGDFYGNGSTGSDAIFKKMMSLNGGDAGAQMSSEDSRFGAQNSLAMEKMQQEQAQKRLQEFRHFLDPTAPQTGVGNPFAQSQALYTPPTLAKESEHRSILNPAPAFTDPTARALHSRVFDDPTAAALGLPNPVAPQKTPAPITAQSVKEQLDPFAAARAKTRF